VLNARLLRLRGKQHRRERWQTKRCGVTTDDVTAWLIEQQRVAQEAALANRGLSADDFRSCVRCGATDEVFSYRFGRIEKPVCRDTKACSARAAAAGEAPADGLNSGSPE
jgi:hypothetical protein